MITSLLLTLSMLGQVEHVSRYGPNRPFWTVPDHIKNAAFVQIQEDWVFQQHKNLIYRWDSVLHNEEADLLSILDSNVFAHRRFAQRYLDAMGFDAIRLCAWGMNAKSGELRTVCINRFNALFKCTYCNGSGKVMRQLQNYNPYSVVCDGCKQSGSFLWYMRYNQETDVDELIVRDIFGKTKPVGWDE